MTDHVPIQKVSQALSVSEIGVIFQKELCLFMPSTVKKEPNAQPMLEAMVFQQGRTKRFLEFCIQLKINYQVRYNFHREEITF